MHPNLTAQLADERRHDLFQEATWHQVRPASRRRSRRTVVGLALVRVGLRLSNPLCPADIAPTPLAG